MKVLIIHCGYRQKGGEDTVVREEQALLERYGINTVLLQFSNEGGWKDLLQLPFNLGAYRRTQKILAAEKPDVVHIHNLHFAASPSVIYAIKRSGVPMVMTLHNYRLLCPSAVLFHEGQLFTASLSQHFPWAAVRRGVYRNSKLLTAWLGFSQELHRRLGTWHLPDRYIALTPHARELFAGSRLGLKEEQLVVKPNFSSIEPPAGLVPQKHFLYAGRLTEEKGIRTVLRVFAQNRTPLRIAGAGPLEDEVLTYSKSFPHIQFLGALSPQQMAAELASATALIFPSLWYEGMPLTIIESFACGTPVIASKLGAMETMITDGYNGLHFGADNDPSLNAAVLKWLSLDEEEKTVYRKNSYTTYQSTYTPEKNAEQLLSVYRSVTHTEEAGSMVSAALEMSA